MNASGFVKRINLTQHPIGKMFELSFGIFKFSPFRFSMTFILILFKNLSSGIGLLLILPLLQIIGFSTGSTATNNSLSNGLEAIFLHLHVPLTLVGILICYVLVVSLVAVTSFAEQTISNQLQQNYIAHFRGKLYSQLLHSQWEFFLTRTSSDLLRNLIGQIQILGTCNYQLMSLLNNTMLILVYAILASWLSWSMTLVAFCSGFCLLCSLLPLHKKISTSGHNQLSKNRIIHQALYEQFSALKMIKGSSYENVFIETTLNVSNNSSEPNQMNRFTTLTQLYYSCSSVLIFSILLYFSISILHLPLETLILLLLIFSRLLPQISSVQQMYQRLLYQLPYLAELKQLSMDCLANQEDLIQDKDHSLIFNERILLEHVSFAYNSSLTFIIRNVTLEITKNTITAIIGPSGMGKTTLADLIVGLLEPSKGQIWIDNQPLSRANKFAWRNNVAYMTQNAFLFNESIRYNLQLFCPGASDSDLWDALRMAAAEQFVAALDKGLDTVIGDRGVRLSGGECQRIALARALLSKPQLLVLDEPTSSLDMQTITLIQHSLKRLKDSMTILLITHQTHMIDIADHCYYLEYQAKDNEQGFISTISPPIMEGTVV